MKPNQQRTRKSNKLTQAEFDRIKTLIVLKVDRDGIRKATGWSVDTIRRVEKLGDFAQYRAQVEVAPEGKQIQSWVVEPVRAQLPLPETLPNDTLEILNAINSNLITLINVVERKRGWLR